MFQHKLIQSLMARSREGGGEDDILAIWEPLATEVVSIVGEAGFNSLYARSIYITEKNCPWYVLPTQVPSTSERFIEIKMNFERLSSAQFNEANSLLLITFIDILASLIGEQLTLRILYSAWSRHISDIADKELDNG